MKTKEEIANEIGRPITRPLGFIQGLFLSSLISSPFILIWIDWKLALKVGLTGFLGTIIIYWIDKIVRKVILDSVNNKL